MKITEIKLTNFRAFAGEHSIKLDKPVACFVGENNTGKTTIFAALDFLRNGLPTGKKAEDFKNKAFPNDPVSVEITIQGNLNDVIKNFSEDRYLPYVKSENGIETIRLRRSSDEKEITQNGKKVSLNVGKITILNESANQYENPTGIDKAIGSLLEFQFVWSDMQASDVVDFGTTKTLGKLFKSVSDDFRSSSEWIDFKNAHKKAFISGENALSKKSDRIIQNIQASLEQFYGKAKVALDFQPPDPSAFIKLGDIIINDGIETSLSDKGSGMQRAFALSVIKVYADILTRHENLAEIVKPIFFFIDEPEISLHPKAQSVLVEALSEISKYHQIFITTHSPHFLKCCGAECSCIHICARDGNKLIVNPSSKLDTFTFSPTLAEINYLAFDLPTSDFHNELYGYIQEVTGAFTSPKLDAWMESECAIPKDQKWIKVSRGVQQAPEDVSLSTYIRHSIHHPENTHNQAFSETELKNSISSMLSVMSSQAFQSLKPR